jgi:flagellar biosynthesis repressor protein FlbT
MALVIDLRKGESLFINGTELRFVGGAKVELHGPARFLFGKQVMLPDEASTPARRLYFIIQRAYIGQPDERASALNTARELIAACQRAMPPPEVRKALDRILTLIEADECYRALRLIRSIIQYEDDVLGRSSVPTYSREDPIMDSCFDLSPVERPGEPATTI